MRDKMKSSPKIKTKYIGPGTYDHAYIQVKIHETEARNWGNFRHS
jgi:hypothetical protein